MKGKSGWTGYTPYLGGLAQTLVSYFKDMQWTFAASIQGEGVLAKSKPHSSLGTMRAWFPTGKLIHGLGSCVPTCSPPVFQIRGWEHSPWHMDRFPIAWETSTPPLFFVPLDSAQQKQHPLDVCSAQGSHSYASVYGSSKCLLASMAVSTPGIQTSGSCVSWRYFSVFTMSFFRWLQFSDWFTESC